MLINFTELTATLTNSGAGVVKFRVCLYFVSEFNDKDLSLEPFVILQAIFILEFVELRPSPLSTHKCALPSTPLSLSLTLAHTLNPDDDMQRRVTIGGHMNITRPEWKYAR